MYDATNADLEEPDWGMFITLCDNVNQRYDLVGRGDGQKRNVPSGRSECVGQSSEEQESSHRFSGDPPVGYTGEELFCSVPPFGVPEGFPG